MVKSIIKRIIVGVGIALTLMAIKGNLFMSVSALSCGSDTRSYHKYINSPFWGDIDNNTSGTSGNINYYRHTAITTGTQQLPFNGYDYIDVYVPILWTGNFAMDNVYPGTTSTGPMQQDVETSPPLVYLEDNTNNPNNNSWTQGAYENGMYRVRYYKKNYSKNYINITAIRIGVPTAYYSKYTHFFVWVNDYLQVLYYKCDGTQAITNAINENTQAVNETNDLINDSNTDDPSSDITSMNDKLASNGSITQLLTLPITLYQNILNATNGACSRFELGELLGHTLVLPCINLQNTLGSSLWSIIDILISGIFILAFRKKMVDIFNNMTSLKDRGNELE